MKNKLLWEKWRPRTLDDIILLPRIRKNFESGVNGNFIFHGHFGTGKTTLARILIKDSAHIEINSSFYTSIDVLRSKIDEFCANVPMFDSSSNMKYVFLDEFERVSSQYQDALKAFIENYSRNVRFILVTNHLNKISPGILSRMSLINFDCLDLDEEKYLKSEMVSRIQNKIAPEENIDLPKDKIESIVNLKFPDFRSVMVELQSIKTTGEISNNKSNINHKLKLSLYRTLYDESLDYDKIYHFLMNKFGPDKIDDMLKLLGRPFIDWYILEKKDINKLFKINKVVTDYSAILDDCADPIVLGMSVIGEIRSTLI